MWWGGATNGTNERKTEELMWGKKKRWELVKQKWTCIKKKWTKMKQKVIKEYLGTGKQNISSSFYTLMCTCNYLCYSLLSQVKTMSSLPSYFFKTAVHSILYLKYVYQMPSVQIFCLIILYSFLAQHMLTTHLNHHSPLKFFQRRVSMKVTGKY